MQKCNESLVSGRKVRAAMRESCPGISIAAKTKSRHLEEISFFPLVWEEARAWFVTFLLSPRNAIYCRAHLLNPPMQVVTYLRERKNAAISTMTSHLGEKKRLRLRLLA